MIQKTVQCPNCHKILSCSGSPGDVVELICTGCSTEGKVTFEKLISTKNAAIEVTNLTKIYGDLVAVNNISFTVQIGKIFAFLGPNGAGKTTTVEMIESIRQPTSGNIKILSKDIKTSFNEVKEKISILPQEFHSFEKLTVKETLVYFSKLYKKTADINSIIDAMDLNDEKKKYYKDLSGGLKQRVGVAISLVNDPDIVFLDEPTTGLDPKARREVWEVIAGLRNRGKTVFLTTHYMEEADFLSDRIGIIDEGKIVTLGTSEELKVNFLKMRSMVISAENITAEIVENLRSKYSKVEKVNGELRISHKDLNFKEIVDYLHSQGVTVYSAALEQPTLEDVFIQITGKKLRD